MWVGNLDFHNKDGLSLQYHAWGLSWKDSNGWEPDYVGAPLFTCLAPGMGWFEDWAHLGCSSESTHGFTVCLELPQSMAPST